MELRHGSSREPVARVSNGKHDLRCLDAARAFRPCAFLRKEIKRRTKGWDAVAWSRGYGRTPATLSPDDRSARFQILSCALEAVR